MNEPMMAADGMSDTPFDSVWSNAGLVELIYEYLGADGALHELAMLSCMCSVTHAVPWPCKALVDSSSASYFHNDCSADRIGLALKALGAACSDALARPSPASAETAFRACAFVGAALGHKEYFGAVGASTLPSHAALAASHVSALYLDSTLDDPFRVVALTCLGRLVLVLGQSTQDDDPQIQFVLQLVRDVLQGGHASLLSDSPPSLEMGSAELVATAAFALSEMKVDAYYYFWFELHPTACLRRRFPLAVRGRASRALAFSIDCERHYVNCEDADEVKARDDMMLAWWLTAAKELTSQSLAPRRLLAYAARLALCSTQSRHSMIARWRSFI
ncbi:hypothetical protein T492DRAFT_1145754 [Pavlovales sp. CCMP2436]|nr:hypothetical protein T492DRAFT_1145754 [Pavlovales sp. CCMP2436]